jgi:hypothetical protein
MYTALLGAHTAMDRIQLSVQQVPRHVKTALKLIIAASPAFIETMLPKTFEAIGRIANESAAYALSTFEKFSSLQELITEIIEVSIDTDSEQKNMIVQLQSQIDKSKHEQEMLGKNVNSIKEQYENARQEVEKARKEYQEANNAIPIGRRWINKSLKKLGRTVVSIVTAPARILGCIVGLCSSNQVDPNAAAETARQNAIAKANHLLQVLKEAEQRQAAFAEQQATEQQKLAATINKIAALDLNKMTKQEIVGILIESILQMNQIKEQWGRLIQFFSKLSVQADSTQQVN